MRYRLFLLLLFGLIGSLFANPVELPNSEQGRFVYDKAKFWSVAQEKGLEKAVQNIFANTGNQIAILTVLDIGDMELSDYAFKIGRKWRVGQRDRDNGILCVLVKKTRQIWISTGYKIEALVPDVVAKRIIDQVMIPAFANGEFYRGMQKALYYLVQNLAKQDSQSFKARQFYQEFLHNPKKFFQNSSASVLAQKHALSTGDKILAVILGLGFFILILLIISNLNNRNNGKNGGGGMGFFNLLMLFGAFSNIFGQGRSGGRGDDGDSRGSFGGGNFGGGGAGGRW